MKHVDLIIRYLSGEMQPGESGAFEQDLKTNSLLREEFEQVSAAWELIRDQLHKRDENAFRARLREAMEVSERTSRRSVQRRRTRWFSLVPLAASLAILLVVYIINRDTDHMFSHFYNPTKDPVLLAYNQETRGDAELGISLYNKGSFKASMEKMRSLLDRDPQNQLAMLYLLLASLEMDMMDEVTEMILAAEIRTDHQLGQSLTWYTTLALIKTDRLEEAAKQLHPLVLTRGSYQTDARKLEKMLLK